MAPKYVAYRLVIQRKTLGLSQRGAAKLLGVTPTQLMEWERGNRMPSAAHLRRLSALYHVLPDALYPELRQQAVELVQDNIRKYGPQGTGTLSPKNTP